MYARDLLLCGSPPDVFTSAPDCVGAEVAYGPGLSKAQLQQTREPVQQNLDLALIHY